MLESAFNRPPRGCLESVDQIDPTCAVLGPEQPVRYGLEKTNSCLRMFSKLLIDVTFSELILLFVLHVFYREVDKKYVSIIPGYI